LSLPPIIDCAKARFLAALEPDGELAAGEIVTVRSHVETCISCWTFADAVADTARALRGAARPIPRRQIVFPPAGLSRDLEAC
jgi:predicted anti-sigma-YlaC factor YlaD